MSDTEGAEVSAGDETTAPAPVEQAQEPVQVRAANVIRERLPTLHQVLGAVVLVTIGILALAVGGFTIAGGAVTLAIVTPLLIFFSPVLVPLGIVVFVLVAVFVVVGGAALATVSIVAWIYNYVNGGHPPGSDQVDAARSRLAKTANQFRDRVTEYESNGVAAKDQVVDAAAGA